MINQHSGEAGPAGTPHPEAHFRSSFANVIFAIVYQLFQKKFNNKQHPPTRVAE